MKISMYKNYYRHLAYPVYHKMHDDVYDPVIITIPDEWLYGYNEGGDPIFKIPDGTKHLLTEICTDNDDRPYFYGKYGKVYYVNVEIIK